MKEVDMVEWLQAALEKSGLAQAELARRLTTILGRRIDRAAVQKMTIAGPKGRNILADELLAIAEITEYPLPRGHNQLTVVSNGTMTEVLEPDVRKGSPQLKSGGRHNQDAGSRSPAKVISVLSGTATMNVSLRERWLLPTSYVKDEMQVEEPLVVEVLGDSGFDPNRPYSPGSLYEHDRVVVDRHDRTPSPPGPFVCWDGHNFVVKQVEPLPGTPDRVRVSSRNPKYLAAEMAIKDAHIIGRVRGFFRLL